jgi:ParB family chromosome partitioning protein
MEKRRALGRGLSALIPVPSAPPRRDLFECPIEEIHPSRENPRQLYDAARLQGLADSIRQQGVVQPLVVRQRPERDGGGYQLIAGERRWRAAQQAGLKSVPVVVKDVAGAQAFELTLVENLQREDLNPIEEAEGYHRLVTEYGYTQEQLAARVGKDRTTVSNALRLLKLPESVRSRVAAGQLSMGHARALLGLESAAAIERTAARVATRQLSVRQTELLVRRERTGKDGERPRARPTPSASVRDLETRLERALGTKVRLAQKSAHAGTVEIDYHSLDQLDALLDKLLAR